MARSCIRQTSTARCSSLLSSPRSRLAAGQPCHSRWRRRASAAKRRACFWRWRPPPGPTPPPCGSAIAVARARARTALAAASLAAAAWLGWWGSAAGSSSTALERARRKGTSTRRRGGGSASAPRPASRAPRCSRCGRRPEMQRQRHRRLRSVALRACSASSAQAGCCTSTAWRRSRLACGTWSLSRRRLRQLACGSSPSAPSRRRHAARCASRTRGCGACLVPRGKSRWAAAWRAQTGRSSRRTAAALWACSRLSRRLPRQASSRRRCARMAATSSRLASPAPPTRHRGGRPGCASVHAAR
mmetsp:Transcript_23070/g.75322  ORF Transcript_23070/g.75322 Transcript_23070/m.75322 type:complete len:302 (+) Transcript_23070:1156-2061(+)